MGNAQKSLFKLGTALPVDCDCRPVVRPVFEIPVAQINHL